MGLNYPKLPNFTGILQKIQHIPQETLIYINNSKMDLLFLHYSLMWENLPVENN